MSTQSPIPAMRKTAKPSLDIYSILEGKSSSATLQNNKNTQPAQESPLKDIYEKSTISQLNESEKLLSAHEEKQKIKKEDEIKEKFKKENREKNTKKSDLEEIHFDAPDHLTEIENSKKTLSKKLEELQSKKRYADNDQDEGNIGMLDDEIFALEKALSDLNTFQTKLAVDDHKTNKKKKNAISDGNSSSAKRTERSSNKEPEYSPQSKSNLTKIIIKRTTTKPRSADDVNTYFIKPSADATNDAREKIEQTAWDDIFEFTNTKDRKEILEIDNKIVNYSEKANKLLSEICKCQERIDNFDASKESSEDEFFFDKPIDPKRQLEKLHHRYTKLVCEIGELFVKRGNIGKAFLSPSTKESPDAEHIVSGISEDTKKLEEKYKKMLAEYTDKINNDPVVEGTAARWNLLAGVSAFSTSFFLTNTATRLMGLYPAIPSWIGTVFAPIVAGALHTIVATPTAKQVMLRTWRSPVMAEMNNYFRLMGAYWHDKREDKLEEKKYASKNPENGNLLTIEERLKEERSFSSIFSERYHSEENPYLFYTSFYSIKGILQTLAFRSLHPSDEVAIITDTLTHAIAGFISGALYLEVQQSRRSQRPGNTVDVNPTREIYQAQTEWLISRRNDLQTMIAELEAVNKTDPRLRELSIKLHKTEVALLTAAAKTGRFTAWLHDFKAQFKPEVLADTLADIAGRVLSLYPTVVVNHFCTGLRTHPNPFLVMLSYVLPAVTLIAVPGFQARGIYGGIIRACIQAVYGVGSVADTEEKAERHHTDPDDEDSSERVTCSDDDSDTDSEREWIGQPLKRDEEMV